MMSGKGGGEGGRISHFVTEGHKAYSLSATQKGRGSKIVYLCVGVKSFMNGPTLGMSIKTI